MIIRFFNLAAITIMVLLGCNNSNRVDKKNILLIIVDDMRPLIGAWGEELVQTPNINQLVKNGISFKRAYAQYANCSPSRMSFLTGLSPQHLGHNGRYNEKIEFRSHITMPGFFKNNGYHTSSFGKVYHAIDDDSASFDLIYDIELNNGRIPWECYAHEEHQNLIGFERPAIECEDLPHINYNDYKITNAVEEHLENYKDSLFFLAVGFRKPHLPFAAPKNFWDMYNRNEIPVTNFLNAPINGDSIIYQWSELASYRDYAETYASDNYRKKYIDDTGAKELIHGYLACISFIDELVGKLVNKLKELELYEKTIIVFTSDHGFHLGDQQIWGKHSSYEKSTHVPLIIVDPSSKIKNDECLNFVELLDIYPTLIELNGFELNQMLDGKSLGLFMKDPRIESFRFAFSQYQTFQKNRPFSHYMAYAVYSKDYNYIEWQDLKNNRNIVQRELFMMGEIRAEQVNLTGEPRYLKLQEQFSNKIRENFDF